MVIAKRGTSDKKRNRTSFTSVLFCSHGIIDDTTQGAILDEFFHSVSLKARGQKTIRKLKKGYIQRASDRAGLGARSPFLDHHRMASTNRMERGGHCWIAGANKAARERFTLLQAAKALDAQTRHLSAMSVAPSSATVSSDSHEHLSGRKACLRGYRERIQE